MPLDRPARRFAAARPRGRVDTLLPAAWLLPSDGPDFPLTTFRLDAEAHETLVAWNRRRSKRPDVDVTPILRGLHELVAYLVPEASFLTIDWAKRDGTPVCLKATFTGNRLGDLSLRERMRAAVAMWLNMIFPNEPPADRLRVAEAVMEDRRWETKEVSRAWRWNKGGTCPEPVDGDAWDALVAHAVSALAGCRVSFRDGKDDRWLVPTRPGAGGKTYDGIELVAYPPKEDGNGGYYSEVLTLASATFPQRGGLHLIARVSMRSWGKAVARTREGHALDVFMPGQRAGGYANWRHASLEFVPRGWDGDERRWMWRHDTNRKVMGVLGVITGQKGVGDGLPVAPLARRNKYAFLPRLGTVHGDRRLPGGAGVGWNDRHDYVAAVSPLLEALGFQRAEPMTRVTGRLNAPVADVFQGASRPGEPKEPRPPKEGSDPAKHAQALGKLADDRKTYPTRLKAYEADEAARAVKRRKAVRTALEALNGAGADTLEFFVLTADEAAPARVAGCLKELLGNPTEGDEESLAWKDGHEFLRVRLRVAHPGVLSERMQWVDLTDAEKSTLSQEVARKRGEVLRRDDHARVRERMESHVRALRGGTGDVACCLLEMPETLMRKPSVDPYELAKGAMARGGVLVQPMLVPEEPPIVGSEAEKRLAAKYGSSVRDCLRMIGVSLVDEVGTGGVAPAAVCVIQRNGNAGLRRPTFFKSQAVPLAARTRGSVLEAALPDSVTGRPSWMPYGRVLLRVMAGEYEPLGRSQLDEDNMRRFWGFLSQALRDIAACGPALVLADQGGTTRWFKALQNGPLEWDALDMGAGNARFTPAMLPGLRLVRTNSVRTKLPQYCQDVEPDSALDPRQWPSGLFAWSVTGDAALLRTAFSLKAKPQSAKKAGKAMLTSRHLREGSNEPHDDSAPRASAQLEELCAVFLQPEDLEAPLKWVDLADKWRELHAAYGGETSLPYPLHELRRIERAIVGDIRH